MYHTATTHVSTHTYHNRIEIPFTKPESLIVSFNCIFNWKMFEYWNGHLLHEANIVTQSGHKIRTSAFNKRTRNIVCSVSHPHIPITPQLIFRMSSRSCFSGVPCLLNECMLNIWKTLIGNSMCVCVSLGYGMQLWELSTPCRWCVWNVEYH